MNKPIRYVVYPGYVKSYNDGQLHYVSVSQLLQLYKVPKDATIVHGDRPSEMRGIIIPNPNVKTVRLYPRSNGRYKLPEA